MANLAPVFWMMGPTSAGKTTLANALATRIQETYSIPVVHWDGDQIRDLFGDQIDFSSESRGLVVRTLVTNAKTTSRSGVCTIVSALTAHQEARELVKKTLETLINVYVHCPIDICAERDPKGLYHRAKAGEIDTLIGFNTKYLAPANPDITIDTSIANIESCIDKCIGFIESRDILRK